MIDVRVYDDRQGRSPYVVWFDHLPAPAAAKVAAALTRTGAREFLERQRRRFGRVRVPDRFGPGYRVYFGKDGERLVILLGSGTKKRQQHDINAALAIWQDYKRRK